MRAASLPRSILFVLFALSVSVGGAPSYVTAQDTGAKDPSANRHSNPGKFRLGPLYLTPAVTVLAGVDNNVYNTPTGIADESVTVRPSLRAVLPLTRRARLTGTGGVAPYYFHQQASQRHTDIYGDVRGDLYLGPFGLFGGIGAARYRERFSLEIDERLLRRTQSDFFGASVHFRDRITASASQGTLRSTFDPEAVVNGASVSDALDRDTLTRRFDLSIPITRKTSFAPWVDLIEDRFLRSSSSLPSRVKSQRYALALDFSELAFFNGRLAAGLHHYGSNTGVTPYDGFFLAVSIASPFVLGTRLQVSSSRDVTYSVTPTVIPEAVRITYVASSYRGELFIPLSWKLQLRALTAYAESRYPLPVDPGTAVAVDRIDHGWTFGVALLRSLGSHLRLGGTVARGRRLSPVDGHSYEQTLAGIAAEARF
jgi:hypothetical protein